MFGLTLQCIILKGFSIFSWRRKWQPAPGTGEPGGLPSMGSHRVGHDWSDLAAAAAVYSQCRTNITSIWFQNTHHLKQTNKRQTPPPITLSSGAGLLWQAAYVLRSLCLSAWVPLRLQLPGSQACAIVLLPLAREGPLLPGLTWLREGHLDNRYTWWWQI